MSSVDHALRLAAILQLEGETTVSDAAARLGVARSTAHRLLTMLVYRDFAVRDDNHRYLTGPVLQLGARSGSPTAALRETALPHMHQLSELLDESVNLTIRTGDSARFIATVECDRLLRVGNREGMAFPAHRISGGLVLLADMGDDDLLAVYDPARPESRPGDRPDLTQLRTELATIRRNGFVVNRERAERGVTAVGVLVRNGEDKGLAGLAVAMPSVRYDPEHLPTLVATLTRTAHAIERDHQLRPAG